MWLLGILIWLAQAALFGYACRSIVENKGYDAGSWFWLGFFFGIFALLVALSKPDQNYAYVYRAESSSVPSGPSDDEDLWTCSCGRRNYAYSNACAKCGKLKTQVEQERQAASRTVTTVSEEKLEESQVIQYLKEYKELLDNGAISQAEFDKKKNELLASEAKV